LTGEIELLVEDIQVLNHQTGMRLPSFKEFGSVGTLSFFVTSAMEI